MDTLLRTRGVTLVEVLVGVALFGVVLVFVMNTLGVLLSNADVVREQTKATLFAMEGQEMVRAIRDADWNDISSRTVGTSYYLDIDPATLSLSTTPEVIDSTYTRTITFASVDRNASDDIVPSSAPGAVIDTGSRTVTVEVSWGSDSVSLASLLTNIFDI